MSNFNSDHLTCDLALFPAQNSPNSAKSNCIFPRKGRGERALTLTYFSNKYIYFFDLGQCQGEKKGQSCKSPNFGSVRFP